jgi:hypothetical protein
MKKNHSFQKREWHVKTIIIGLVALSSISAFAETLKVGIYSQVGSVTEFCSVNSAYIFVNDVKTASNANLGKIFKLQVPENSRLVIRDASVGRGQNECNKIVIEKTDGAEIRATQVEGTINFEVEI